MKDDNAQRIRSSRVWLTEESCDLDAFRRIVERSVNRAEYPVIPTRSATPSTALLPQRNVGFPIPNAGLLLGFQGQRRLGEKEY